MKRASAERRCPTNRRRYLSRMLAENMDYLLRIARPDFLPRVAQRCQECGDWHMVKPTLTE